MSFARECVKWLVPLFYALVIMDMAGRDEVLDAAADAFAYLITPEGQPA